MLLMLIKVPQVWKVILTNGGIGMIQPHSRSTKNKYQNVIVFCGLLLLISLFPIIPQAFLSVSYAALEELPGRQLELNKPIERGLSGGQSHAYQVQLPAGQYIRLVIEQRGIDLEAKLIGPDGKLIIKFDADFRSMGQETVSWVADEAGTYRLEVGAKYKNSAAGSYEIRMVELHIATDDNRSLYEALRLKTEFLRLFRAGKYDEARPSAERALAIREKVSGSEHQDVADALNDLANYYSAKDEYQQSEQLLQRAMKIREKVLGPDHPGIAITLNNLAILYKKKGDYGKAESHYQRALAIDEKALGPDHPHLARSLNNLANLYSDRGDYAKAESLYSRALTLWENALGPEHPDVASALNNIGNISRIKGDYIKAESLFQRALTMREKELGPDHPDVATSLNNLAYIDWAKGAYAKAEPLFQRALMIREKVLGREHPLFARSLTNLAILYSEKGDYAKAEPLYQRALTIRENVLGPEHPDVAYSLNNLAGLYYEIADYARAEIFFQRALIIKEKVLGQEHADVITSLNNIADLYRLRGDFEKAEPLFQRSLNISVKVLGQKHPTTAAALNNLASLYSERGDFEKVESLLESALSIREEVLGPVHQDVAITLNSLGNFWRERGDYTRAEPFYQRALVVWEKALGPEHHFIAYALGNLAQLYYERGEYDKVEPLAQRALNILEKSLGSDHPRVANIYNLLAMLNAAKADYEQALAWQTLANTIDEHNFASNLALGSERQKLDYLALFSDQTDFTLSLHSQAAPNDPQALNLAFTTLLRRKGRVLDAMTDTIASLRRHATPEDQALLNKLTQGRARLAALTLRQPDTVKDDSYPTRLKNLKTEVDALEEELSSRSPRAQQNLRPVTISAVQAALPAGSALVEFTCFTPRGMQPRKDQPPRYLAYLLPAQGQPKWVDLGEASAIDQAVDEWRNALRDPRRPANRLARVVDEKLMRPVRARLSELPGLTLRLVIAPDGELNLIPFAALIDEHNRYLVERYTISYLTSGRDLLRLPKSEPSRSDPLLVANPDFGKITTLKMGKPRTGNQAGARVSRAQIFFQPLPGTEDEALAIKSLLPKASVLHREGATETALKQAMGPKILHIATHGFFLDYQESALAEIDKPKIVSPASIGTASTQTAHFTVQLEATPIFALAQVRVKQLIERGVDAYLLKSRQKGKGDLFRVRAGNFLIEAEAQKYGADLLEKGIAGEFFVAPYIPPQGDVMEQEVTIASTEKADNSSSATALPVSSQSLNETRSTLRLNRFAAQVKDPLIRSGLVLAGANQGKSGDDDGVLTAMEAAYLDLMGTKLVVLSACDTGVGEVKNGEGVRGLRRALVLAGSESQVMSLWPVSDKTTKDFMIKYYTALEGGEGRSEGLRQVQLRFLHGLKEKQHPFYWAAFIQSGEWANLDGQR